MEPEPAVVTRVLKNKARAAALKHRNQFGFGRSFRKPCEVCGSMLTQMHHEDYTQPLKVRWFCRKHHSEHEKRKRHCISKRWKPKT